MAFTSVVSASESVSVLTTGVVVGLRLAGVISTSTTSSSSALLAVLVDLACAFRFDGMLFVRFGAGSLWTSIEADALNDFGEFSCAGPVVVSGS